MDANSEAVAAFQAMVRRAAVVELAIAASDYQPTSYDDAIAVRDQVSSAIAAEMDAAGDAGDDATYAAFATLRTAVIRDLAARGASLAPLKTVSLPASQPALTLAERLYADAARADDLVARARPRHPLFMPTRFRALAA